MKQKSSYESPELEFLDIQLENGFATSDIGLDNPIDGGPAW